MLWIMIGGVAAATALLWATLRLENDPMEQALAEIAQWDQSQKRLRKVLGD